MSPAVASAVERHRAAPRHLAGQQFERVFLDQIADLWETRPFPVPGLADLAPSLRGQLRA